MTHQKSIIRSMKSVALATVYTVAVLYGGTAFAYGVATPEWPCENFAKDPEYYLYADSLKRVCALLDAEKKNDCAFASQRGTFNDQLLSYNPSHPYGHIELKALENGVVVKSIELQLDNESCAVLQNLLDTISDDETKFNSYSPEKGKVLRIMFTAKVWDEEPDVSCPLMEKVVKWKEELVEMDRRDDWTEKKKVKEFKPGDEKLVVHTNRGMCTFYNHYFTFVANSELLEERHLDLPSICIHHNSLLMRCHPAPLVFHWADVAQCGMQSLTVVAGKPTDDFIFGLAPRGKAPAPQALFFQ